VIRADQDGFVATMDAYAFGVAAWRLGAGRARKEDPVSASAGVLLHRKPGDAVQRGDMLYELRAEDAKRIPGALETLDGALTISPTEPNRRPLISERIA